MPFNLLKRYNQLLELMGNPGQNQRSLRGVFNRDFRDGAPMHFKSLPITPTFQEGVDPMERLFWHLTTAEVNDDKKREFELDRSVRLHWVRFQLTENTGTDLLVFKIPSERRVYLIDTVERYVVILEPLRNNTAFYLITAYPLGNSQYRSMMNKCERRGERYV